MAIVLIVVTIALGGALGVVGWALGGVVAVALALALGRAVAARVTVLAARYAAPATGAAPVTDTLIAALAFTLSYPGTVFYRGAEPLLLMLVSFLVVAMPVLTGTDG